MQQMFCVYLHLKSILVLPNDSNRLVPLHQSGSEFTRTRLKHDVVTGVASKSVSSCFCAARNGRHSTVWGRLFSLRVSTQTPYYVVGSQDGPGCRRSSVIRRLSGCSFFTTALVDFRRVVSVRFFCEPKGEERNALREKAFSVYANRGQFTDAASTLFHSV